MPEVIESFDAFTKRFPRASEWTSSSTRMPALQSYFTRKGIIQVEPSINESAWPKLIYPPKEKIELQLQLLAQKQQQFFSTKWNWQLTHLRARSRETLDHARKLADPLFWQHIAKTATDEEYRAASKEIGLKTRLVANKKYRPMIDSFVNNPKYREQLLETVKHSPAYHSHKGLARQAEQQKELHLHISQSQLDKTQLKLDEFQEQMQSLRELLKWSNENH
jgi:hypothetical protein